MVVVLRWWWLIVRVTCCRSNLNTVCFFIYAMMLLCSLYVRRILFRRVLWHALLVMYSSTVGVTDYCVSGSRTLAWLIFSFILWFIYLSAYMHACTRMHVRTHLCAGRQTRHLECVFSFHTNSLLQPNLPLKDTWNIYLATYANLSVE